MSSSSSYIVAPETVAVELERPPVAQTDEYWPLTLDAVNVCDLSYMNDKWSEEMIRDGMRAIIRVGQLPGVREERNQRLEISLELQSSSRPRFHVQLW